MSVTMVLRRVYVHARDEATLARRVETFTSALRVCDGSVVSVEKRRPFHGQRIAVVLYEFPIHRGQRPVGDSSMDEAPPPESGVVTSAALGSSHRASESVA